MSEQIEGTPQEVEPIITPQNEWELGIDPSKRLNVKPIFEAIDDINMTLGKHSRDDIPFCREIEEGELVALFGNEPLVAQFRTVDI